MLFHSIEFKTFRELEEHLRIVNVFYALYWMPEIAEKIMERLYV